MERDKKSLLMEYIIAFSVGVAITFVAFLIQGLFNGESKDMKSVMRILHNGFFTAGLLLALFSGLLYVADQGIFLGIGYTLNRAKRVFFPVFNKETETYAEYRERKVGRKNRGGKLCLFLTGLFFILVSIIFLIVWYQV